MRKQNKFSGIFLALIFSTLFIPLKNSRAQEIPGTITISEDTSWTKNTPNLVFDRPVVIENDKTLTIEKGTRIVFKKSPSGYFYQPGIFVKNGKLVVNGTGDENVIFTSAEHGFTFSFTDNSNESFLRYARFENGGFIPVSDDGEDDGGGDFVPHIPALEIRGGKVHIENSRFINSRFLEIQVSDDIAYGADGNPLVDENGNVIENKAQVEVINSNFSYQDAVESQLQCWIWDEESGEDIIDRDCQRRIYLKNNWYDSSAGPKVAPDYLVGGGSIRGDYTLDGFRTSDFIADPVVILPGIMGSMPKYGVAGELKLEPITQLYSNLVASLEENGYTKNLNLFEFPYEWRNSNVISAEKLKDKVAEIKNETGASRVDLVAHSMGGLVSRYYIESPLYQNDVDQLVTLGTPHKGSPKSYPRWEAAEGFFSRSDKFAKVIFTVEAHALGYDTLKEYIQKRIKSVQELLPDYDYLYDVAKKEMRDYPENYPANTFLEYLNDDSQLANLEAVNFVNIVGNVSDDKSTTSGFRVVASPDWEHGIPENFYDDTTDRGMEYDEGDQTVPLSSAIGIPSDKRIELPNSHNDLPTEAQCYVFKELSGKETCEFINTFKRVKSLLTFGVFSPIDIQVVETKTGRRVGKDFETGEIFEEIPGAYYTGYDTDAEFLTIPNPEDGEYKILTQGTGDGEYKVEVNKISEDPADPEKAIESTAAISGTASAGQEEERIVEVSGAEVTTGESEIEDNVPPSINIKIPEENKEYKNNKILNINFEIKDDQSAPENIQTEIFFDDQKVMDKKVDLSLEHLGDHSVKITARDETGNGSEKAALFKTATDIGSIVDNVSHYSDLKLIKNKQTKKFLLNHLRLIKLDILAEKLLEKNRFLPIRMKQKLLEAAQKQIKRQVEFLISYIQKNRKEIREPAGSLLIESLNYIIPK